MIKSILIFLIINIFMIKPVLATGVNLDIEVLKDQKETYSSITDMYNIPIFTDEYKENLDNDKELRKKEENIIINNIFKHKSYDKKDSKIAIREESEKYQLFYKESNLSYVKEEQERNHNYKFIIFFLAILLSSLTFILTKRYYKRKFERDDKNVYYIDN